MIYSTKSAHIYTKPGKYKITVKKDAIPGSMFSNCTILNNPQPKNVVVKYCIDVPTCLANNTAIVQDSDKTNLIPDYKAENFKSIAAGILSSYSKEITLPENSFMTKEKFEVMMQELFNFASFQYKSALNTLKDEVKIGLRVTTDISAGTQLSNATLDDYLLADNYVVGKELSSIETILQQSRQYGIYGCQKVLSSYKRMLSSDVFNDDVLEQVASTISSHVAQVKSTSGQRTFTLNAKDLAEEKFSTYSFTTNRVELSTINDLSNINQTFIEAIYIPNNVTELPDGFLSNAINLRNIYFDCDASKPQLSSIGENAFYKSFKLVSLVFPNSLRIVKDGAFHDSVNLQYVKFGNDGIMYNADRAFELLDKNNCVFIPAFNFDSTLDTANRLSRKLFGASDKHVHDYQDDGRHVYDAVCNKINERVKPKEILQPTGCTPLVGPAGDWYNKLKDLLFGLVDDLIDWITGGGSESGFGDILKTIVKTILDIYGLYGIGTGDPSAIANLILSARLDHYNRFQIAAAAVDYEGYINLHKIKRCMSEDPYQCDLPTYCVPDDIKSFNGSKYGTAKIPDGTVTKLHTGNSVIDLALDGAENLAMDINPDTGKPNDGPSSKDQAEQQAKDKANEAFNALRKRVLDSITPCP